MPRVVRANFKTGVLPKPRQVVPVKYSAHELAEQAKIPQAFEDPKMAPKKSSANPPPRLPKTASEKIAASAKDPRARTAKSEEGVWKEHIAEVRRTYLKSSLLAYEKQEKKHMQIREQRRLAGEKSGELQLHENTETLAEALTKPTIESSLKSEFIRPRTAEEKEELTLKRAYNRRLTQQRHAERQHEQLLQLYQDAASYIVTEEQLEERLQHLFKPEISVPRMSAGALQNPGWLKYFNNDASRVQSMKGELREAQLLDALNGTVETGSSAAESKRGADAVHDAKRRNPGLKAVREILKE